MVLIGTSARILRNVRIDIYRRSGITQRNFGLMIAAVQPRRRIWQFCKALKNAQHHLPPPT
jgi:hypothetical protein